MSLLGGDGASAWSFFPFTRKANWPNQTGPGQTRNTAVFVLTGARKGFAFIFMSGIVLSGQEYKKRKNRLFAAQTAGFCATCAALERRLERAFAFWSRNAGGFQWRALELFLVSSQENRSPWYSGSAPPGRVLER